MSAADVNGALGTNVGPPISTVNGTVTVCTYAAGPQHVIVRFAQQMTMSSFQAGKADYASHGEATSDVTGIGDSAYSSTLGSGAYQTATLVVLKGSTELLITAPASLSKVETLAGQILPKL